MHAGQSPMRLQCSVRHCACSVRLPNTVRLAQYHLASPTSPLLPTKPQSSGFPASKKGMIATIVTPAQELGLATQSASGAELFGGHLLRVGGIQFLGRCGVEVARIQVLAEKDQSTLLSIAGAPYFVNNLSFGKIHLYLFLLCIYMFLCWCCVRCGRSCACNVVSTACCKRTNNMPYVRCKQNI